MPVCDSTTSDTASMLYTWPKCMMPPLVPMELLVFMPSCMVFMSAARLLCTEACPMGPPLPPTSTPAPAPLPLRFTPSVMAANAVTFCALGSASSVSRASTACVRTLRTSTVGLAPVTVTVSSSDPTFSSALTGAVNPALSVTPSRFTTLKPGSVNVTA